MGREVRCRDTPSCPPPYVSTGRVEHAVADATAGEIFNTGMRFAGHTFLYDGETFIKLAAECGFDARRVDFQQSEVSELMGLDLRSPETAVSMYFDCYKT